MLGVNAADSSHFKRNVTAKLKKWGYVFQYERAGVTIQRRPALPEERLKELLIRKLGLDVQIDPVAFSLFITAFSDIEGFAAMPWGERAKVLEEHCGVIVDERTLRNWFSKLTRSGMTVKNAEESYWRTSVVDKTKSRSPATKEEYTEYNSRKYEFLKVQLQEARKWLPPKEAQKEAWDRTYRLLWAEYGCCFYSCKRWMFSAFNADDETLREIYELVDEIASLQGGTPQTFS